MQSAGYFCLVLTKLEFCRQMLFKITGIQRLETLPSGTVFVSLTDRHGDSGSRLWQKFCIRG